MITITSGDNVTDIDPRDFRGIRLVEGQTVIELTMVSKPLVVDNDFETLLGQVQRSFNTDPQASHVQA